ncbi:MAG: type II toxin-antitoxin system VapC family toxin [Sporichthyaceae bacterium]
MIVFDAVVLIAYLDSKDVHHARAEQLLVQEIDDDFGVNSLTLAEVLVGPARADRLEVVVEALRDLEVRELAFPDDAAAKLAHLRADTNLTMPDCCVLLAAAEAGARIASFDDRLRAAATARGLVLVPG